MTLKVIRSAKQMKQLAAKFKAQGKSIGVVPTMGALHEGHLSLIRLARENNDVVVVTIFVNPMQFGPQEDFKRYPRAFAKDVKLSREAGADFVFAPNAKAIYPPGFQTAIEVQVLGQRWEGATRPGHFQGVATVVFLLFQITHPARAYFGQKDYQQVLVIRRMAKDLQLPVEIIICPTLREPDGLAMSSRNSYLNQSQRSQAVVLYRALQLAEAKIEGGERHAESIVASMRQCLNEASAAAIDYVSLVDAETLKPLWRLKGRVAVLLAVRIGSTRLIDNLLVVV